MINYILAYYQAITNGSVTVGRYIRKWYQLIVKGLEDKRYGYDPQKAKAVIVFAENYCRHHEGALGGQRVKLELWQKAFLSVVFGIVDENGERYFREVVLIIGRKTARRFSRPSSPRTAHSWTERSARVCTSAAPSSRRPSCALTRST